MKSKAPLAAHEAVRVLNEALALDPATVERLLMTRYQCRKGLADHSTIQCRDDLTVSGLGLINGLFGVDDESWGWIEMNVDDDGVPRLFTVREPPADAENSERPEYVKCVRNNHADFVGKALCGRSAQPYELPFNDLDHAFFTALTQDRLLVCSECVDVACTALNAHRG